MHISNITGGEAAGEEIVAILKQHCVGGNLAEPLRFFEQVRSIWPVWSARAVLLSKSSGTGWTNVVIYTDAFFDGTEQDKRMALATFGSKEEAVHALCSCHDTACTTGAPAPFRIKLSFAKPRSQ